MDVSTAFQHLERNNVLEDVIIHGILLQLDDRFIVVDISEDPSPGYVPNSFLHFEDPMWNEWFTERLPIMVGGYFRYIFQIRCSASVARNSSDVDGSAVVTEARDIRFAARDSCESWTAEPLPPSVWQKGALELEPESIQAGYHQESCFVGRCVGFVRMDRDSCFYLEHADSPSPETQVLVGRQERAPHLLATISPNTEHVEGGGLRGSQIVVVRGLIGKGHGEFEHEFRELSCISVLQEDCIRNIVFDSRRCVFDLAVDG